MAEIEKDKCGNSYVRVDDKSISLIQKLIATNVQKDIYGTVYLSLDKEKTAKYKNACWIRLPEAECDKIRSAKVL